MNKKYVKRIIAFAAIILFVVPLSLKAQTTQQFSNEELAQMLAPIALYPDALLSQMLIAASYPFEVVEADRWMARNPGLADEALDNALSQKDWDVSVLSLCHYPKVLTMMSENINWTAKLGDAFVNQEQDVMDTVQELRARASEQGNLTSTNEQRVIVEERIIRIEPAYNSYLYVPVYDPVVVFGPWWFPAFPPFPIFYPGVVVGPRIVFAPRLFIGFGVIGWSAFDWHAHNIVITNLDRTRRFYRHADVHYRPERVHWRPDQQKRVVQERRWRESPRFQPTVKSPREVPPGGFKRNADVVAPPRSKTSPVGPRVIDKDSRPSLTPKGINKGGTPAIGGPRVIDRGKVQPQPQFKHQPNPVQSQQPIGGPRIIDRGKIQPQSQAQPQFKHQSQPRTINKDVPAMQNRGPAGVGTGTIKTPQTMPRVENKRVTGTVKSTEHGGGGEPTNQRNVSGAERGGEPKGNRGGFEGRR